MRANGKRALIHMTEDWLDIKYFKKKFCSAVCKLPWYKKIDAAVKKRMAIKNFLKLDQKEPSHENPITEPQRMPTS